MPVWRWKASGVESSVSRYLKEENQVILFGRNRTTYVYANKKEKEVVHTAISLLQKDVEEVFGGRLEITEDPDRAAIVVGDLLEEEGGWKPLRWKRKRRRVRGSWSEEATPAESLRNSGVVAPDRVSPWVYFADVRPVKRAVYLS